MKREDRKSGIFSKNDIGILTFRMRPGLSVSWVYEA